MDFLHEALTMDRGCGSYKALTWEDTPISDQVLSPLFQARSGKQ